MIENCLTCAQTPEVIIQVYIHQSHTEVTLDPWNQGGEVAGVDLGRGGQWHRQEDGAPVRDLLLPQSVKEGKYGTSLSLPQLKGQNLQLWKISLVIKHEIASNKVYTSYTLDCVTKK